MAKEQAARGTFTALPQFRRASGFAAIAAFGVVAERL